MGYLPIILPLPFLPHSVIQCILGNRRFPSCSSSKSASSRSRYSISITSSLTSFFQTDYSDSATALSLSFHLLSLPLQSKSFFLLCAWVRRIIVIISKNRVLLTFTTACSCTKERILIHLLIPNLSFPKAYERKKSN